MKKLVLLRHGESSWNKENRFTGWTDVDLSEKGRQEAGEAGAVLKAGGYMFDVAYTSVLKRAIRTLWIALDGLDLMWIPVHRSWRLNERHFRSEGRGIHVRRGLHFGAEARHPHAVDCARRVGPDVDSRPPLLAAQRAALWRAAGFEQSRNGGQVRRGASENLAAQLRRPAARAHPRRRAIPRPRPAL